MNNSKINNEIPKKGKNKIRVLNPDIGKAIDAEIDEEIITPLGVEKEVNGALTINRIKSYLSENFYIRYNVVLNNVEADFKDGLGYESLIDYNQNTMWVALQEANITCSYNTLDKILKSKCSEKFNPLTSYLDNLPTWDGHDYIQDLSDSVTTTDKPNWDSIFKNWFIGYVASAYKDENINHKVLVLDGDQGIGKTHFTTKIQPKEWDKLVYFGKINPDNKDTLVYLAQSPLIVIDEFDNLTPRELSKFKDIVTQPFISLRKSYGINYEKLPHRASFIATTNADQILTDPYGSRRFSISKVISIDRNYQVPHNQLYAQALSLYKSDYEYWGTEADNALTSLHNEDYRIKSSEEELLNEYFRMPTEGDEKLYLNATAILNNLSKRTDVNTNKLNNTTMGKALTMLGYQHKKINGNKCWIIAEKSQIDRDNEVKEMLMESKINANEV